ncbi:hypothetical protein JCM19233_7308 [Vibrio astriarenae]|nr:hypothetical protein JCM19233_7308 [Vibrio sp. C7]
MRKRKFKRTEEQKQAIYHDYIAGVLTVEKVAEKHGVSCASVYNYVKQIEEQPNG